MQTLRIDLYIEALIFAAEYALTAEEVKKAINISFDLNLSADAVLEEIEKIREKYDSLEMALQLVPIARGFLFMTKPQYHKVIEDYLRQNEKRRLSKAAIETLSIIAYKQPVTKSEIESIRGVGCDYTIQKLLEKELIEINGRDEGPGRPLLYGTTVKFLDHFGIKDTSELPNLKEFDSVENSIGEEAEL